MDYDRRRKVNDSFEITRGAWESDFDAWHENDTILIAINSPDEGVSFRFTKDQALEFAEWIKSCL